MTPAPGLVNEQVNGQNQPPCCNAGAAGPCEQEIA